MRIISLACLVALSGCAVADTAVDIAKIPVGIVSAGVDAATTSRSEADEERGRNARLVEQRCREGRPLAGDACLPASPR